MAASEIYSETRKGNIHDSIIEKIQPMHNDMAKHIANQRQRLGCNMAVARALFTRKQRESLLKIVGPDLIFVVLNLTKNCIKKRLKERHGDSLNEALIGVMIKMSDMCEPAGVDEKNAYNVYITEDMTPDDVVQEITSIIEKM